MGQADAPKAEDSSHGEAVFEAWARGEASSLPPWWPDGERGEQAARFMSAAITRAWREGFNDERVRYEDSAFRHSEASRWAWVSRLWADRGETLGAQKGEQGK